MKAGVAVPCAVCGYMKKPVGRSAPLGVYFCEPDHMDGFGGCSGYWQEPYPGSLWPGETEQDFGYPVSADGTEEVARPAEGETR